MKTFLNVLYRRILYKIPLKLLLILLVLFGLLFFGFSNALNVDGRLVYSVSSDGNGIFTVDPSGNFNFNCFRSSTDCGTITMVELGNTSNITTGNPYNNLVCLLSIDKSNQIRVSTSNGRQCVYNIVRMNLDNITDEYCSVMSSLECQTEYNLIPIDSVDQNYCTTNNLCPIQECPSVPFYTGDLTQLYINNVLHVGAPTILMNIPDEIDWDYAYTMGGNVMDIDIVGYNVDYDKINEQINLQNFKPSSEDLSQVVSGIIPLFVPGLCIILLLYFIFRFIKKIF